jgi:hypothetical protein
MNERVTENIVRDKLYELGYKSPDSDVIIEEQKSAPLQFTYPLDRGRTMQDEKLKEPQTESEEYIKFKTAMMKIVSVQKAEIVKDLPKMFRERKPPTSKRIKQKVRKLDAPPNR